MVITNGVKNKLEKKGYGYLVVGQDIPTKDLNAEEIGVILKSKNQDGDYVYKLQKMPFVCIENQELYDYISERRNDNYAMYDFSNNIPNVENVKGKEYHDLSDDPDYENGQDSVLDLERGF